MILVSGAAGEAGLTGTLYEPGESRPSFRGAPEEGSPYVWVCDAFYEVESGGQPQTVGDRELRVAFESPAPRGFPDQAAALRAGKEHIRTQFARLGVPRSEVDITVRRRVDA
ncbi:hypothetical protein EGH22_16150 [Halomicroarcula sp. F28]|uniref:DUF7113 family protein n=1 Tax=Haloarcula salinisoli TaxID=2487746 RepID=UPI001C72CCB6|nr:hypothetical protein [Halomicroarcula salinisoli]MBX0287867.1 hypothetical protein [Halomicroarcula salinisoli]